MVTPRYLPEIGGVERHVHEVATRIVDAGEAEVTVLTTVNARACPRGERGGRGGPPRPSPRPAARPALAPGLTRAVASATWDLVHVQSYHTLVAPIAMATAARPGLPFVVTFHGGGHSGRVRNHVRGSPARRVCARCSLAPRRSSPSRGSRSTSTRVSCGFRRRASR